MENKSSSSAETERQESPSHISVPILNSHAPRQVINKVRPQFRNRKIPSPYDPVLVSMGPYHHGKPELSHAEQFKQHAVKAFVLASGRSDRSYFYQHILSRVHDIRACYDDDVVYGNHALARLILRDACFFIQQIRIFISPNEPSSVQILNHFGPGGVKFIARDLLLLENQIPLWIIKLLISLQLGEPYDQWDSLLCRYISYVTYGSIDDDSIRSFPWGNEDDNKPFHFLHAVLLFHKSVQVKAPSPTLTGNSFDKLTGRNLDYLKVKDRFSTGRKKRSYQLRSITDLKAKGICCRPSEANIRFVSYPLCGKFYLTPVILTNHLFLLYSNFIAYELSPTSNSDFLVSSYVNLMKSLIQSTEDVKELREQCVLVGNIGSDDEVVRVFKEIDTFGIDNSGTFLELKASMDEHCCSLAKTWKAELMFTYFGSPFTAIALFATLFLLSLTTIQTFYTMHPAK